MSDRASITSLLLGSAVYVGSLSYLSRIAEATLISASSGQGKNQSIVQQLTRPGNLRHLTLRTSPMGLIDKMICSLSRTLSTKVRYIVSGDYGLLSLALKGLVVLTISSLSSSYQRLGISPEFRRLLMSYKKSSSTIWLSVNKKVMD